MDKNELQAIKDKIAQLERDIEQLRAADTVNTQRLDDIESELSQYRAILDEQTNKLTHVLRKQTLILSSVVGVLTIVAALAPEQIPQIATLLASVFAK